MINREKLLSLSDEELLLVAEEYGYITGSMLDRISLIEELIREADPIYNENLPVHVSAKRYDLASEPAYAKREDLDFVFLNAYNETKIHLAPHSPFWAFADWEVEESLQASLKSEAQFSGYFLRLYCLKPARGGYQLVETADSTASSANGRQYIQLVNNSLHHKIALFADVGRQERFIAESGLIFGARAEIAVSSNENTNLLCAFSSEPESVDFSVIDEADPSGCEELLIED